MRLRRFLVTIALAIALVPGPAAYGDLKYRAEITGAEDSELADLLDSISELKTLEDKPPASEEALRRRALSAGSPMPPTASAIRMWNSATTSTRGACEQDRRNAPRANRKRFVQHGADDAVAH